jgi:four helix bundle protein
MSKYEIRNKYEYKNPKLETNSNDRISKFQKGPMAELRDTKRYDLEDRTLRFALRVRAFVKKLPKTVANIEDSKQLVNASGSVGANYIEANEALSKKDFVMRIKICRKEAKESRYWLKLVNTNGDSGLEQEREELIQEATELMNIFGSILRKSE